MSKRRITAMIDDRDISRLVELARRQRVSLAWIIRDAVADYLTRKPQGDGPNGDAGRSARVG